MSTIKADNISPVGSTLNLTAPVAGLSVAGGLTVGGIAFFSGGATFNSTSTFTGLVTLTGGATSAAVISCATAPTQGQHLANKTYVDNNTFRGATYTVYTPFTSYGLAIAPPTTGITRASGFIYTAPNYPLYVSVTTDNNSGTSVVVNGVTAHQIGAGNFIYNLSFIVPPNATYRVFAGSGFGNWSELRYGA